MHVWIGDCSHSFILLFLDKVLTMACLALNSQIFLSLLGLKMQAPRLSHMAVESSQILNI